METWWIVVGLFSLMAAGVQAMGSTRTFTLSHSEIPNSSTVILENLTGAMAADVVVDF